MGNISTYNIPRNPNICILLIRNLCPSSEGLPKMDAYHKQIRRAIGPGRDRSFLFFVLVCYPPLSPPGSVGPRLRPTLGQPLHL